MDTARRIRQGVFVLTLSGMGVALAPAAALGQVRERDVTITGPRGRTVERHMESRLGPNGLTRDLTITRPGGTYSREAHFSGAPAFRPGPRSPVFVERNVFVNGGGGGGISPLASFGLGAALGTGAGVLLDRTLAPPPPPVYFAPPVYVSPALPPTVIYSPPAVYQSAPPQTLVVDQVAQQIARFSSSHVPSRREAAAVLGRLGDPRAVPALVGRLKLDSDKTVRINAANAISRIGDPTSAIYLERASIYDKRQDVRDAAAAALARMPREVIAPQASVSHRGPSIPPLDSSEVVPPPPTPGNGLRR